jgi:3-hydroxybutyryl-CoA dehydrogenase
MPRARRDGDRGGAVGSTRVPAIRFAGLSQRSSAEQRISVVGSGQMGGGIAEVAARQGLTVTVVDLPGRLEAAAAGLAQALDRSVEKHAISASAAEDVLQRVSFTSDYADLAAETFVIEAVPEDRTAKEAALQTLDRVVTSAHAVFASNTSSIPIIDLAEMTSRPERVIGMHFFNPVRAMKLVEVIPSVVTDADVIEACDRLARLLGKELVRSPDRAGFVVNALLFPYILNAIRMVEAGVCDAEEVDTAMRLGANMPLGPLALADLVGLDTTLAIAESLYDEYRESQHVPPPLLRRMVGAGRLGRKSGRGFHHYE